MRLFRQFLVVLCMVLVAFSPLQAALHHLICHAGPSVSFDFSPVGAKLVEAEQSHRAVNHRAVNHCAVKKCGCGVAHRLSSIAESPELSILTTDDSDCQVCQQLAEPGSPVRTFNSLLQAGTVTGWLVPDVSAIELARYFSLASPRGPPC
jgi:hypothetical protein